jgi:hypothetical protein
VCAACCLATAIPSEWLVAIFDAIDTVTASDWVQPFDRIDLNGGFRPNAAVHTAKAHPR